MRVYLAGPITGLEWDGAVDWRQYAEAHLRPFGIESLSPLRGKDYLAGLGVLRDQYIGVHPLSTGKGIVARDRFDTTRADVVLMNLLGAQRVSIGTMIEVGWADAARVPLVLVSEAGNVHDHAMVNEIASFRVSTLDEGLSVVRAILDTDGALR